PVRARFSPPFPKSVPSGSFRVVENVVSRCNFKRPRADSNRRIEVLQTSALPLGYGAKEKASRARSSRAGNRTRTGDLLHGKQTLYQLSYSRARSTEF